MPNPGAVLRNATEDVKALLSFRGATPTGTFIRLPKYILQGTTPLKGLKLWTKIMSAQIKTTKPPWSVR